MKIRARWLRRFLWLAGFGCLWLNVIDDPPLHTGACVQNVATDAATVARITAAPTALQLRVFDEGGQQVAEARDDARRRHALRVEGLRPGQAYDYVLERIGGGEAQRGSFRTAPVGDDAPVRFAFCGDSGDQPWWVWLQRTPILHLPARWRWFPTKSAVTTVGAQMAAYAPDFALHLGDVVYPKGLHAHYSSGFFRPFGELLRTAPVYAVLGNHDVMNDAGHQALVNFDMPQNAVTGDERCYSFAYGPVRVIVLDCNTWFAKDRFDEDHPSRRYLLQQLQSCREPWVVVASHFPMLSASRQGKDGALLRYLLPELERYGVSLYLSGHDHCYQRFGPNEVVAVPLVVSGGGGKRLYDISDNPLARKGAEVLEKSYHWCGVEVAGASFVLTAHAIDGRELDRVSLRLPGGDALDRLRERNPRRAERIAQLKR